MTLEVNDPRHGTLNGYNHHGCRCPRCKEAIASYRSKSRPAGARSELLNENYRVAREAGFGPDEARRRQHWADPLSENR